MEFVIGMSRRTARSGSGADACARVSVESIVAAKPAITKSAGRLIWFLV
jgi:hypothetical protein